MAAEHATAIDSVTRVPAGDRALGCRHVDTEDPVGYHMKQLIGPDEDTEPGWGVEDPRTGQCFRVRWLFLCEACDLAASAEGTPAIVFAQQDFIVPEAIEASHPKPEATA